MDSNKNGVIYFSMGTNLDTKDLPANIKIGLLKLFGDLKQTVLWKMEEDLPNLPANVHILKWAPQMSILCRCWNNLNNFVVCLLLCLLWSILLLIKSWRVFIFYLRNRSDLKIWNFWQFILDSQFHPALTAFATKEATEQQPSQNAVFLFTISIYVYYNKTRRLFAANFFYTVRNLLTNFILIIISAHKNCILFISHGGLLSLLEAIHTTVPVIGIPVYGDQFVNIKRAVTEGYALEVDLSHSLAEDLKVSIQKMLHDIRLVTFHFSP